MSLDASAYRGLPTLVTGGAGFIGSHLVRALGGAGARVRVMDNLCAGNAANLAEVSGDIEFVQGDITDPVQCERAAAGV
ncbi:MAG: SDR family NAD(P)-dependent oxidoreductase, partial [Planctomycetes bacterium]|nr:SDR family NAD(P)-dependent oxidoreductase [Planctomycetota bacterium]